MKSSATLSTNFIRASEILARVHHGQSLAGFGTLDPAVQDLCYGSLRDYHYADIVLAPLLRKPVADPKIRALLACAVREVQRGRSGHFTIVNEAVAACEGLGQTFSKAFVNGVLRNYLRQREVLEEQASRDPIGHWRHPQWWIERLKNAYPQQWQNILEAGNQHPPMGLRVNRRKTSAQIYGERLKQAGIDASCFGEESFLLSTARPAASIPGFAEGEVSVQDVAAQWAARLLDLRHGMRVLDACAAPGGKTAHILECADVELLALDRDEARASRIGTNLERLGLGATVRSADATAIDTWWDGKFFDRVLLDAPCSASGVVRRHPDIKWLRREEDIQSFATQQRRLLESLWQVLAPGGKLLYVTCSVFPRENDLQLQDFQGLHSEAKRLALPPSLPADGQLLPDNRHDGFYYALLEKDKAT